MTKEPSRPATECVDQSLTLDVLQARVSTLLTALEAKPLSLAFQQRLLARGHCLVGFLLPYLGKMPAELNARFDATAADPSKACIEIFSCLNENLPNLPFEHLAAHDPEQVLLTAIADCLTFAEELLAQQAPEIPPTGDSSAERIATLTAEKVLAALSSAPKDLSSPAVDSLAKKEKLATSPLMNSAHEAWDRAIVHSIPNLAAVPAIWQSLLKIPPRILPEANAPDDTPSTRRALAEAWEEKYRILLRALVIRNRTASEPDLSRFDEAYIELEQLGPHVVRILSAGHLELIHYNAKPIPRTPQDDDPYQLAGGLARAELWRSDGYHARYVVRHAQLYREGGRPVLIPGEVC